MQFILKYIPYLFALDCYNKPCGEECAPYGICDGNGRCADPIENPCIVPGCEGKKCGEFCLEDGDIAGVCNKDGECDIFGNDVNCSGELGIINFYLFRIN